MKTIKQLREDIAEITNTIEKTDLTVSVENRLRKRILFLRHCIMYLETKPDRDFLVKNMEGLEKFINAKMEQLVIPNEDKLTRPQISKIKKDYEEMFAIPKMREQVKAIRFLLAA